MRVQGTQDVVAVMRAASRHGVPVTPRAGGTGRTGGAVPVAGGIVLAFERCNRIKGIEADDLVAVVEPGVITGEFHAAVEAHGLFYPPDPELALELRARRQRRRERRRPARAALRRRRATTCSGSRS